MSDKPKRFSYDEITDDMVEKVEELVGFNVKGWGMAPSNDIVAESINVGISAGFVVRADDAQSQIRLLTDALDEVLNIEDWLEIGDFTAVSRAMDKAREAVRGAR